jgi:hypothetical protein
MAKKRRKKRRPDRPAARGAAAPPGRGEEPERPASARAERKEQARRERERRIKQARRRQRIRRATRWGAVLGVAAAVGGFAFFQIQENRRLAERAAVAAEAIGCDEVQEPQNEGTEHLQPGDAPPQYGTTPATSGPHSATPLPSDPAVYSEPVPEPAAVHNLEHGYVLIYYRQDGQGALDEDAVDALADVAEGESEVIMAPYDNLPDGTNLAFVAWTRLRDCAAEGSAEDVALAATTFIDQFKNTTGPESEVS